MERPTVELTGTNGNVFSIIGLCRRAARKAGWDRERVSQLVKDLTSSGSYDEVLQKVMTQFEVE